MDERWPQMYRWRKPDTETSRLEAGADGGIGLYDRPSEGGRHSDDTPRGTAAARRQEYADLDDSRVSRVRRPEPRAAASGLEDGPMRRVQSHPTADCGTARSGSSD